MEIRRFYLHFGNSFTDNTASFYSQDNWISTRMSFCRSSFVIRFRCRLFSSIITITIHKMCLFQFQCNDKFTAIQINSYFKATLWLTVTHNWLNSRHMLERSRVAKLKHYTCYWLPLWRRSTKFPALGHQITGLPDITRVRDLMLRRLIWYWSSPLVFMGDNPSTDPVLR